MAIQFNPQISTLNNCQLPSDVLLTPDALMNYCATRLEGLDTQMRLAFADQQKANYASSLLSQLGNEPALAVPDDTVLSDPQKAGAALKDAYDKIKAYQSKLSPDDPTYAALGKLLDNIGTEQNGYFYPAAQYKTGQWGSDANITASQFKSIITDAVGNIQKDLNSNSELTMINLQSLMSQRQSAIQMCTNLVQSLGDQMDKIAQNIGH